MIKIDHVVLASPEQIEFIIEGMRNPMNSWERSDSSCGKITRETNVQWSDDYFIGTNDRFLMHRLSIAGTDHRKFMRMMPVYVRITAPLYWWKEFDTYKVGTVTNSCSSMHKITEAEFTLDDFSTENLFDSEVYCYPLGGGWRGLSPLETLKATIEMLNNARQRYLAATKTEGETTPSAKDLWWQMIQLLPSSYNQTRNVMMNYEVLANIYKSRKNHRLDEWVKMCNWIKTLPCSELITGVEKKEEG